jgi:hypothetical protein
VGVGGTHRISLALRVLNAIRLGLTHAEGKAFFAHGIRIPITHERFLPRYVGQFTMSWDRRQRKCGFEHRASDAPPSISPRIKKLSFRTWLFPFLLSFYSFSAHLFQLIISFFVKNAGTALLCSYSLSLTWILP